MFSVLVFLTVVKDMTEVFIDSATNIKKQRAMLIELCMCAGFSILFRY